SQQQEFKAMVNGSATSEIKWSLEPEVGTISSEGVYTAPAKVPAKETVKVIARSKANPRESATATIILEPSSKSLPGSKSLTVTPQQFSLSAGQRVQFHVQGEGGSVDVQWSLEPALGSISAEGVYQAPFPVLRVQTVKVKATSRTDAKQSAVATVT